MVDELGISDNRRVPVLGNGVNYGKALKPDTRVDGSFHEMMSKLGSVSSITRPHRRNQTAESYAMAATRQDKDLLRASCQTEVHPRRAECY